MSDYATLTIKLVIYMRIITVFLLGLLAFGCTQTPEDNVGYGDSVEYGPVKLSAAQFKLFMDAGCTNHSGYLHCSDAPFAAQFGCASPILVSNPNSGAALNPATPLVECRAYIYEVSEDNVVQVLTPAQQSRYFSCGGGMMPTCTSYIAFEGGRPVQMMNPGDLARRIAPISSETEALNYVLLSKDAFGSIERPVLGDLKAWAQRQGDRFLVVVFYSNPLGCYDKIDYEEVSYLVSANGAIEETGRKIVYTENLGFTMCVD